MTDQVRRDEVAESELLNTLLDAADAPAADAAPEAPEQTAQGTAKPTPEPEAAAPVAEATEADQTSEAPAAPVAEVAEAGQTAEAPEAAAEGEAGQMTEAPAAEEAAVVGQAAEAPAAEEAAVVGQAAEAPAAEEAAVVGQAAEAPAAAAGEGEAAGEGASFTPVAEEGGRPRRMKDLQAGMELEGRVTSIALYGIFVDVGVGRDGLVHISEMSDTRIDTPSDMVQIGDTVKVRVKSIDPDARRISLTMRSGERSEGGRGRGRGAPRRSEVDKEKLSGLKVGDVLEGTITGFAPFGAFADIGVGKDGLVHVSELADGRVEKPEDAVKVGEKHTFKVIEIAPDGTRISLSLRKALRTQKMQQLEPGTVIEGTVSGIAPFGAFVDIGVGRDGLVHISALSNSRVGKVEDVVKVGDKVTVKVLEVDQQSKRISLTMRLDDSAESAAEAAEEYESSSGGQRSSARTDSSRYAAAAQAARERGDRGDRRDRRDRRPSSPPVSESYSSADYEEEFTGDATLEDLLSKFGGPTSTRRDAKKGRQEPEEIEVEEDEDRQSRRQRDAIRRTLQQVGRDE